jgi:hypothetical protein
VYSSLGFKYRSITSDVQYDTDFDLPSREHCGDCGSDSCSDYWWDPFVFGIAFFSAERRRHYDALNRYVFRPLSNLDLVSVRLSYDSIDDNFRYDLKNLPSQTARIYQLALKHMEKDDKQLPKEIQKLKDMLGSHDNQIRILESDINKLVKTTSTFSASPVKTGIVYRRDYVARFISKVWISCKDEGNISDCVDAYIIRAIPTAENGYFQFDGLPVAQGDERELNSVKDVLHDILKNKEIIKNISDLKSSAKSLNDQIKKIKELVKPIADSIDQDLYSTRIKGCCTNLTLLKKI